MVFRVSEFQNNADFLFFHSQSKDDELSLLEHIASGKKINRASDDPIDFQRVRQMESQLEANSDFEKNIETLLSDYQVVEDTLNTFLSDLEHVSELAVQGASETYGASARNTIADELEEIYNGMISNLNTKNEGRFIFSGTATSTQPFDSVGTYLGNNNTVSVRISETDTLVGNMPGDEVAFGAGGPGSNEDFLDLVQDLITELRADNTAGIQANLPRLKTTIDRVNSLITGIGSKTVRLLNSQAYYKDFELNLQKTMSELEDADLAEEISKLNQNQTAQEAQLRSQSTLTKQTLLDYLG